MNYPRISTKHFLLLQVNCAFGAEKLETNFVVIRGNHVEQVLLNATYTAADLGAGFEQIVGRRL